MQRIDAMKRFLALLAALVLVGCGQSGPLYIPDDPSRIENPPPPAEESADEESAGNNDDADKR